MKLFLILGILAVCTAAPQDLTGKTFTFPKSGITSYVKLFPSRTQFGALTLCQRFLTDLRREYAYFSLSTTKFANGLMLIWREGNRRIDVYVNDVALQFNIPDMDWNAWHSLCTTFESSSGMVQLWLDGQQSARRAGYTGAGFNDKTMIIMLGQEQDSLGGSFDHNQSYTGMMSDVHMWDKVLPLCQIQAYLQDNSFTPGNVINWKGLEYRIFDQVLIEDKQSVGC